MIPVSLRLWKSRGSVVSIHSIDVARWGLATILRCAANASHRINTNNIRATNERREPNDETTFHFVNASG